MKTHRFFRTAAILLLVCFCSAALSETLQIPGHVKVIQDGAFQNDSSLRQVILPDGLISIGAAAFAGTRLTHINFPASLASIAENAFSGCSEVICEAQENTAGWQYAVNHPEIFLLETHANWKNRMRIPSSSAIRNYNKTSKTRSPYITGWMKTDSWGRFTGYAIDFKSDHVPDNTYYSLSNFYLEYPSLTARYSKVYTSAGINGYAGLQKGTSSEKPNTILSLWDIFCEDSSGKVVKKIRANQIYPSGGNVSFEGEGEGVHCLIKYPWKPDHWYRMRLEIGASVETGNSILTQSVKDLVTGKWTVLCQYDLKAKNVVFYGDTAIFLENFRPETSGDVRTMELRNIRVRPEGGLEWRSVRSGWFNQSYPEWTGSFQYGTDDEIFWIITTGVPGMNGENPGDRTLTVTGGASGTP